MREAKMVVDMVQNELLPQAVLTLTECGHPSPHRRDMLAHRQVEALNERRIDLPAVGRQHLLDCLHRAEHHAVAHPDQTSPAYGLDHLRIEQLRPRYPARRGHGAFALAS